MGWPTKNVGCYGVSLWRVEQAHNEFEYLTQTRGNT